MHRIFVLLLPFLLISCNGPYTGKNVLGAEEFVIDSYKIRQGKFSILAMLGKSAPSLNPKLLEEFCDVVHEDDVLTIAIHHPTRRDMIEAVDKILHTIGYRVQSGKVQLPDLGEIEVKGLSLGQIKEKIQKLYSGQIQDVEVFISFRDRLKRRVELAGLVMQNSIPVDGSSRLWDVLSKAKVPPEANLFMSYVERDGCKLSVDLNRLIREGDMSQNIVMHGGDKVYIADPMASYILVIGEVREQKVIPMTKGYMSLRESLAAARGIPFTGDRRFIQVIRGGLQIPKIYTLHWRHIIELPNDSLLCMPGDIIYVATSPIADWNRFVSQILPTFAGLEVFGKGVKTVGIDVGVPQ